MMRRFARCLFSLAAALSLLMCVAVCALWVRSYWVADFVAYTTTYGDRPGISELSVASIQQSMHMGFLDTPAAPPPSEPQGFGYESHSARTVRVPLDTAPRRWGFGHDGRANASGMAYRTVWLPHWAVSAAATPLPVAWIVRSRRARRRRRRLSAGLCPACGYDLRASSGRCPECGMETPMAGATA